MTLVAVTHGFVPAYSMGGEVSLYRMLAAVGRPSIVLTCTDHPYTLGDIRVLQIDTPDVLDVRADPAPIAAQLAEVGASVVVVQNELSYPAVRAAMQIGVPSVVSVHTPPKYGGGIRQGLRRADAGVYNTAAAAKRWGEPDGLVLHPPTGPLPTNPGAPTGDAYVLLSSLLNKGVLVVLELAKRMPGQRFIIVRSPAEATHGIPDIEERAAALSNVELHQRVPPEQVAATFFSQARILLVPSKYETYGMSTVEAAGYGIPTVHVDTPHVREGIGAAAVLVPALNPDATEAGVQQIESDYTAWSRRARARAEELGARQRSELTAWAQWIETVPVLSEKDRWVRQRRIGRR